MKEIKFAPNEYAPRGFLVGHPDTTVAMKEVIDNLNRTITRKNEALATAYTKVAGLCERIEGFKLLLGQISQQHSLEDIDVLIGTFGESPEEILPKCKECGYAEQDQAYLTERERAEREHPASEWAAMERHEMYRELAKEVNELHVALWANDLHGEHGIIREALHVRIVSERIAAELQRRAGEGLK